MGNTFFFKNKFDLIVSLGEDCACTSYLRRFNLQDYTFPFDWLTRASFTTRIDLICNNFENFLRKENIYKLGFPYNTRINCEHADYEDKKLEFNFYHDFNKNLEFTDAFNDVKNKYNRRIARFYNLAENSNKILFVWWDRSNKIESDTIIESYKRLSNKFPKKDVYLLLIFYSEIENHTSLENEHIYIAKYNNLYNIKDHSYNDTLGNTLNNYRLFKKIRKQRSPYYIFKYFLFYLFKVLVVLIPFRETQSKLRQKIRYIFFKAKL